MAHSAVVRWTPTFPDSPLHDARHSPTSRSSGFLYLLGTLAPAGVGAGRECHRCVKPLGLAHRCQGIVGSRTGTARRNSTPHHDDARRRPPERRARRISRYQCDAAFDVGTLARIQETIGRARAGQPAKMENRRLSSSGTRKAIRRCHSFGSKPKGGTPYRPASEPETTGVSSPSRKGDSAAWRGQDSRSICRIGIHACRV